MGGTYAVIGDPIGHSLSPAIHSAAFRHLGMDCSYIAYRVGRDELEEGVSALRKSGIAGFNVTIPHKVGMMRLLDRLDETCSVTGAANTVSDSGGSLVGYNTDMGGFLEPLERRGIDVSGMAVLLLGAGGAARAIVAGLASKGAGSITVAGRTPGRAEELCAFARKLGTESSTCGPGPGIAGYDMVVNATPAGMNGEPAPVSFDAGGRPVIYDIVYRPANTDLLRRARDRGCTAIPGYEMLLGQAARSFEIWHGIEAPYDAMKRALLGGF